MTTENNVWFSGPVKDAVSLVAQRNCVFLVYIYDESDKSNILNATLKDEQVTKAINEHTVALSMEKSSENAIFFGQYYPIQSVPVLYFLKQGTIRDFGTESISSQEIVDKINRVNAIATSAPIVPQQTQQQQSNIVSELPQEIPQPIPVVNHTPASPTAVTVPITVPTSEATSTTPSSTSHEDKIKAKKAELQKQLEQVRKDRADHDRQESQALEIKRRQEAKLMQDAQQDQKDKETKIYFEKLRQEKLKDEEHKKKVRQQIATDRAEKIAQRNAEKERKNSFTTQQQFGSTSGDSSGSLMSHEFSNLNVRQLDGTNIRNKFQASSTLSSVREWIKENRTDNSKKPYKLSSQFPTRLFTEADDDATLSDLNLCPSATIIMKPIKSTTVSSTSSSRQGARGVIGYAVCGFDFIYGIIIAIMNILTGFFTSLFPSSINASAPHEVSQQQQQQPFFRNMRGGQRLGGGDGINSASSSASTAKDNKNNLAQKRKPYATRVNTLHDEDEDDEKEKRPTYNGNSVNHE